MKIDSIDIFHVRMPLLEPWRTAYGSDAAIETVLTRMRSEGLEGWGEACPLAQPSYSPEYAGGVFAVVRDCFAPRLLGKEILSGEELQRLLQMYKGNQFAKAALDTAWWDLYAKSRGLPLYKALGGQRDVVEAGADFGIRDSMDELLEQVDQARQSGAPRIKLKFAPGWDLPVVEKVRNRFPDIVFHIDCNANYTLRDRAIFREMDRFDLAMIEQPLMYDDLADHAELQTGISTPICLDESINAVHRMEQAIRLNACRWVNIKPGRVGGLTIARQLHALCESSGIRSWVGGMLESAVGAMHCAALATLPNFTYPADLFPSSRFYSSDLSTPEMQFTTPWKFILPREPGLGATPNPDFLRKWTLQSA